jgi:SAM-dependent methyltransferase
MSRPRPTRPTAKAPLAKPPSSVPQGRKAGRRPPRQRRALSHLGGDVALSGGEVGLFPHLTHALATTDDEGDARAHVHGFHSYPARMHPVTARRLVERLARPGDTLLDPFCGSGTVLVEGRLAGCTVLGVDANPLAVELAWLKVRGVFAPEQREILAAAREVSARAEGRRRAKAGASRSYPQEDVAMFDPHVLLELDGLRSGIALVENGVVRRTLALVLSSILVKVSRRPGDTAARQVPRRLASGFTLRLFSAKTEELVRRLAEFESMLRRVPGAARALPTVRVGDARMLEGIPGGSVDVVLTSPPYPGNYDYLAHHAARLRWLGIDSKSFAEAEIGARRHLEPLGRNAAAARWSQDLHRVLAAMARALRSRGIAVLLIADSVVSGHAVFADDLVRELGPGVGLGVTAVASQIRPHFHTPTGAAFGRRPRREHAIVLRPMLEAARR